MTDFAEIVGNDADNQLAGASYTITYGLGGNDTLTSTAGASYQVLFGGEGDDLYRVASGHVATIYDTEGSDVLEIAGLPSDSDASVLLTIDDRHLVASNTASLTDVYVLNYRNSSIETVVLDDATIDFGDLIGDLDSIPGYLGNFSFEELRAQGVDLPTTAEARQDIVDAVSRGEALKGAPDRGEEISDFDRDDALAVARLYGGAFGRQPDVEGVNFWIDRAEDGLSRAEAAFYFLDSEEFTRSFGDDDAMGNARFVEVMYGNVLGRDEDAAGFDFWVGKMNEGLSREDTLVYFADSAENIARSGYLDGFRETGEGDWAFVV